MAGSQPHVFSGTASTDLTRAICAYMGLPEGRCEVKKFSDGETWVKIDENVRGMDCFVVQSTRPPANDNLMELLQLIDALRRASAKNITAVIPYFGYARQDRKDQGRVALTAKLVANLITTAGADRVLTLDLHAEQVQGFFDIPVDHLYASAVLVEHILRLNLPNLAVVSPDVGNVKRARSYATALHAPLVIIDKRRPCANVCEVLNIIGHVEGHTAFLFDDLIDTAGTICNAVSALRENGAGDVYAACTHAVLSGPARERLSKSGIKKLFITDTIPQENDDVLTNLEVVTVASLLGEAILRINNKQSLSTLFEMFEYGTRRQKTAETKSSQPELDLFKGSVALR